MTRAGERATLAGSHLLLPSGHFRRVAAVLPRSTTTSATMLIPLNEP